jgi:hypothetical protein
MAALHDTLFPAVPRQLPHNRGISIALRTLHLLGGSLLLGGHVFEGEAERLFPALMLTVTSGAGLIILELYRSCDWAYQGMGALVILKTALTAAAGLWWSQRVTLLIGVVILGSIGSHMPACYRHYSFRHGRVLDSKSSPAGPSSVPPSPLTPHP